MSKHTKGPWVAKQVATISGSYKYWVIEEKQYNGFQIASTSNDEVSQGEANARLMAAAPELLEAAEYFVAEFKDAYLAEHGDQIHGPLAEAFSAIRRAIAEAKGEKEEEK